MKNTQPRRRWPRFSLRTLLVITAALALLLRVGHHGVMQWWLATSLQESGVEVGVGEVTCWFECSSDGPAQPLHPNALGPVVGGANVDTGWANWRLFVAGDMGFHPIEWAYVDNNPSFRNDSVQHLCGLPRLRAITLINTGVTDGGLIHLRRLPQLESLNLLYSKVSDAGLDHLKELTSLRFLHLDATAVTSAGMADLCSLKRLEALSLMETCVGDAGLVHVGKVKSLRTLQLHGTKVTDAGLMHLTTLTQLRALYLSDTAVTDAGVEKLRKALPHCKIYR